MATDTEERFSLPEVATDPALAFYFSTWQARSLSGEFAGLAQSFDLAADLNLFLVLERDKNAFREYAASETQAYQDFLQQNGLTEEEGIQLQDDPRRLAPLLSKDRTKAARIFLQHLPFLLQTLIVRAYDAFYSYGTEVCRLIIESRLANLDSKDTLLGPLFAELTNNHLVYIGRSGRKRELYSELRTRLGLPWVGPGVEEKREILITQMRHLIAHNRAIIHQDFIDKVGDPAKFTKADLGKVLPLEPLEVIGHLEFLHDIVKRTDQAAIKEFGLVATTLATLPATEAR